MTNKFLFLMILLSICVLPSCSPKIQHADSFYNYNGSDFPREYLPLIKPVEATRDKPKSSWNLELLNNLYIDLPKSEEHEVQKVYIYSNVTELEKFAVKDDVIMAYSGHVNQQADAFIQENFYHWFVIIPGETITEGFQTEYEFNQYIETIGIHNPDWQSPDDAFDTFLKTGCLDWFPDCK